jgi:predicted restriction endonuclease
MVYFCEGNDKEKLDWFKIINIAGEKLTDQELRNAVYTGKWLSDAKLKFSKRNCAAYLKGNKYLTGEPIRQDYLETALKWINNGEIESYMAAHQHCPNANELFSYFLKVIDWVEMTFVKYRKEMKGQDWGTLYNNYQNIVVDTAELENEIAKLMADDDVSNKRGVYPYVPTRQEKYLSIRIFDNRMKRSAYEKQKGICKKCGKKFEIEQMEADHITPWSKGGKTVAENCQMLCRECNRRKSDV